MEDLAVAQPASVGPSNAPKHDGPIPMSFPAILRTPGLADRFAHLRVPAGRAESYAASAPKKNRRDEKEGKRWVRRKENARFVGNAHIVLPSQRDYALPPPRKQTTFPHPLPHYLSRNNAIPPVAPPDREPNSANAGRFSMSLKGMRRELRKSGPRTELLVREVEGEIVSWLRDGGVMLSPGAAAMMSFPGLPIGTSEAINEVSRTPLQLIWSTSDDAFTRYVVHCCARYHDVVSFSKDTSGQRLTYLLRPNVTSPDFHAPAGLDTPPPTDLESSAHEFDSESDVFSDRDNYVDAGADSDIEPASRARTHSLAAIAEASAPPSPSSALASLPSAQLPASDDEWSIIGDGDADIEDDSGAEQNISVGVASLALIDPDRTPRVEPRVRQVSLRSHLWARQRRSASSPSRSPARRMPSRVIRQEPPCTERTSSERSFCDYLFA